MYGVGFGLTRMLPSLVSWFAILLPIIIVYALTFWVMILCGVHATRWTMDVTRSLFRGGVGMLGVTCGYW